MRWIYGEDSSAIVSTGGLTVEGTFKLQNTKLHISLHFTRDNGGKTTSSVSSAVVSDLVCLKVAVEFLELFFLTRIGCNRATVLFQKNVNRNRKSK